MIYLYHMDFLITERQLKHIVENKTNDDLPRDVKYLFTFTKDIFDKVRQKYGIDVKLLLTWGAAVGGFVAPLDNYIRENEFNLSEDQVALILFGCASTLVLDNEEYFRLAYDKIKEEGLSKIFNRVLNKGLDLKESFINFILSINVSFSNIVSLVRYSFLIPIIPDLLSYIHDTETLSNTAEIISKRILASGVLTVSSEILFKIIKNSLNRIRK